MILPLSHERMTFQRLPWVTIGILAVNVVVFLATWPTARAEYAGLDELRGESRRTPRAIPRRESCERCPETVELQSLIALIEERRQVLTRGHS